MKGLAMTCPGYRFQETRSQTNENISQWSRTWSKARSTKAYCPSVYCGDTYVCLFGCQTLAKIESS